MTPFSQLVNFRLVAAAGTLLLVSGCGVFGSKTPEYYHAEPLEPIKVPEGMQTRSLEPLYLVPELEQTQDELQLARGDGAFEVPRPDPLPTAGETSSGVKIQRLGEERWILVDAPTSQVWPLTQSFLSRYGIAVASSDPAAGLIETRWMEFKADNEMHHRYRIWIEQGLRPDTTEVHVVHRQAPAQLTNEDQLDWTRRSENPEREAFLLDELAAELAASAKNSSASLLGQRVGGQTKADIDFVEGEPVLQLKLPYDRAWATVNHSLGQEEIVVWESDSAKGVVLVGYLEENRNGFFRNLFSNNDLPEEAPASLDEVLGHLAPQPEAKALFADLAGANFGDPSDLPNTYLIVFQSANGETSVYVRSAQGTKLSPRLARRLLTLVRRNLI